MRPVQGRRARGPITNRHDSCLWLVRANSLHGGFHVRPYRLEAIDALGHRPAELAPNSPRSPARLRGSGNPPSGFHQDDQGPFRSPRLIRHQAAPDDESSGAANSFLSPETLVSPAMRKPHGRNEQIPSTKVVFKGLYPGHRNERNITWVFARLCRSGRLTSRRFAN